MVAGAARRARHFRTSKYLQLHVRKWLSNAPGRPYIAAVAQETGHMIRKASCMTQDRKTLYKALTARDRRFDGIFFVGVTSTGIYCRPVCTVKTPKEANCVFFDNAQEAEQARFRPCLRCRPEL